MKVQYWKNIKKNDVLSKDKYTFLCAKDTITQLGLDECPNVILLPTKNINGSPFTTNNYIKNIVLFNTELTKISKNTKVLLIDKKLESEIDDIKKTSPETYNFIKTKMRDLDTTSIINIYEIKIMVMPSYSTKLIKFKTSITKCRSEIEKFADIHCDFPYVLKENVKFTDDDNENTILQEIVDINSADNEMTFFTCFIYKLIVK